MIAEKIKRLREAAGLTQVALAKEMNITRSAVNSWEMGISAPSTAFLVDLANFFHVSTDYLLGMETTATLDISGLNDKEVMLVYELVQHFKEQNQNDRAVKG